MRGKEGSSRSGIGYLKLCMNRPGFRLERAGEKNVGESAGNAKHLELTVERRCLLLFAQKTGFISTDQTVASSIHQLRLGHGYFRSFLIRLPSYDSTQCQCSERVQSAKHLQTIPGRKTTSRNYQRDHTALPPVHPKGGDNATGLYPDDRGRWEGGRLSYWTPRNMHHGML